MIELADKWTRQPQRQTDANPRFGTPVGLWNLSTSLANLVDGRLLTPTGTLEKRPAISGVGYEATADASYLQLPDYSTRIAATGEATAILVYEGAPTDGSSASFNCPWCLGNGSIYPDEFPYFGDGTAYSDALSSDVRWVAAAAIPSNAGVGLKVLAVQARSGAMRMSLNGITISTYASACTVALNTDAAILGSTKTAAGTRWWRGRRSYAFLLDDRRWSDGAVNEVAGNPWLLFAKRPKRTFVAVSGGSTYSVSLTESASAGDAPTTAALRVGAMAESATATETIAGFLVAPGAITEAATATESAASSDVTSGAIAESASASDAAASIAVRVGAISEAVTASDVVAALATMQSAVSEAASASDLANGLLIAGAAVAEAAAAADTATTGPQYDVALAESASSSDALQAAAQLVAAVTEAATSGAAFSAAADMVGVITESASASDSISGGATVYNVSLTELAAAVAVLTASLSGDAGMLNNVRTSRGSARAVIGAAARNIIRGYRPS